jgi:ATP-dependent DNA ligase
MKGRKMKITHNPTIKALIPELRGTVAALRWPCFGEIKYDGEATIIHYDENHGTITTNKYGTIRTDWSKLDRISDILRPKVKKAMFLGELYYQEGKTGALYELLSHKEDDDLNISIYDVVHIKSDDLEMDSAKTSLIDRKEILVDLFREDLNLIVKPTIIECPIDAKAFFEVAVQSHYEGVVFKPFDGNLILGPCPWVKMKYKDRNELKVSFIDPVLERIEVENISIENDEKCKIVIVGVKCPNKYKKNLKIGDIVTIEHQGVLESGSLRHPVFIASDKDIIRTLIEKEVK